MNTTQLQEWTQELIDDRKDFDKEYFQNLPRSGTTIRQNWISSTISGDEDSLTIELSWDWIETIIWTFTNLQQVKSFVIENLAIYRKLTEANVGTYTSYESWALDWFTHRVFPTDESSRNEKFHFFLNSVCQLHYWYDDGISNKFRNYTSRKVMSTIKILEERYIPEEYLERFREHTNFYRTSLENKKYLWRLFRTTQNKENLMLFLEENSWETSICHSAKKWVSIDFLSTVISWLTETGRKYFEQITYSGWKDNLFETLSKLDPKIILDICNSIEDVSPYLNNNNFRKLLNSWLESDAIVKFINSWTALETVSLLKDDNFMRKITPGNYKKHFEIILSTISISDFIKVKNILLFAISNVSNPNWNWWANLIPDNMQILLEKIKEFEEFEEYDHEETGRILILWSYDPDNITSENIRAHLIERVTEKASSIDAEITRQEWLKKEQTDAINRLSWKNN